MIVSIFGTIIGQSIRFCLLGSVASIVLIAMGYRLPFIEVAIMSYLVDATGQTLNEVFTWIATNLKHKYQ